MDLNTIKAGSERIRTIQFFSVSTTINFSGFTQTTNFEMQGNCCMIIVCKKKKIRKNEKH